MLIAAQTVIQYWINNICSTNQSMLLQLTSSKKKEEQVTISLKKSNDIGCQ
jgi:hypothetical protein